MLNDMIADESQYAMVPKDFSMPKETILETATLLQKAYNNKELSEDSNGALYYSGITEDFGGLIDFQYYKQMHQNELTVFGSRVIKGVKVDVRSDSSVYITIGKWVIYLDDSTQERIISDSYDNGEWDTRSKKQRSI